MASSVPTRPCGHTASPYASGTCSCVRCDGRAHYIRERKTIAVRINSHNKRGGEVVVRAGRVKILRSRF